MKKCDVCGKKLGIINRFAYNGGYICKSCYKKASRSYTETIKQKSLDEIISLCNDDKFILENEFVITGKIGNYLLFDEKNNNICILNNRMTHQKLKKPEIYSAANIKKCQIVTNPNFTINQLEKKIEIMSNEIIKSLKVIIHFNDNRDKEILLIKNGVKINSYAFKKTLGFAKRINEKISELMNV